MFKKLIFTTFLFIASTQTFAHQDNQVEINKREAILFSSLKNFNKEELNIVKEYAKAVRKMTVYLGDEFNNPGSCFNSDPNSLLALRATTNMMKVAKLQVHEFIQNMHMQFGALSSLVQNIHLDYEGEFIPFCGKESASYIASLTERILETIKAIQN